MEKVAVIVGTPGSGKTTIMGEIGKRYKVFNTGTMMLEIALKKNILQHRDQIRYLDPKTQTVLRLETLKQVNSMKDKGIVETHISVKRENNRYFPGFTIEEMQTLKGVKALIYIDAKPEHILKRRQKDSKRVREKDTIESIEEQKIINLSMLSLYSMHCGAPIHVIKNEEEKLAEAIESTSSALKKSLGE